MTSRNCWHDCCGLFPSPRSDVTGTMAGNRHYRGTTTACGTPKRGSLAFLVERLATAAGAHLLDTRMLVLDRPLYPQTLLVPTCNTHGCAGLGQANTLYPPTLLVLTCNTHGCAGLGQADTHVLLRYRCALFCSAATRLKSSIPHTQEALFLRKLKRQPDE